MKSDAEFISHHERMMASIEADEIELLEERERQRRWNRSRMGRLMNSHWFPTLIGGALGIFFGLGFAIIILHPEKIFRCVS